MVRLPATGNFSKKWKSCKILPILPVALDWKFLPVLLPKYGKTPKNFQRFQFLEFPEISRKFFPVKFFLVKIPWKNFSISIFFLVNFSMEIFGNGNFFLVKITREFFGSGKIYQGIFTMVNFANGNFFHGKKMETPKNPMEKNGIGNILLWDFLAFPFLGKTGISKN